MKAEPVIDLFTVLLHVSVQLFKLFADIFYSNSQPDNAFMRLTVSLTKFDALAPAIPIVAPRIAA